MNRAVNKIANKTVNKIVNKTVNKTVNKIANKTTNKLYKIFKIVKYPIFILLVVGFIIALMVLSQSLPKKTNDKKDPLNVTITESFKNGCSSSKTLEEKDKWCNELNDMPCKTNDCCVLLSGTDNKIKCVGGKISGPTFSADYEYFNHKQKCYEAGTKMRIDCP